MYNACEAAKSNWPGEPESDPLLDDADSGSTSASSRGSVQGTEITPTQILQKAFKSVLRDDAVEGGKFTSLEAARTIIDFSYLDNRMDNQDRVQRV